MLKFENRLAVFLAFIVTFTLIVTLFFVIKNGVIAVTQPLATLIGIILVPSIALFGFLFQKRIERNYEISKEARSSARAFIDSSTSYLSSLIQEDFTEQVEKFQLYQSNWFQLHTVMPEVFHGNYQKILERHYNALTAIQHLRNKERNGVELNEDDMKKLFFEVKNSEIEMVLTLAKICTGIDLSELKETDIAYNKAIVPRNSRGNIALQMGTHISNEDIHRKIKSKDGRFF